MRNKRTERILQLVRGHYPEWKDFSHPEFVQEERSYKQAIVDNARSLLEREALGKLLETGDFDAVLDRFEAVAKTRGNNLLFRGVPRSGDLAILYHPGLDRRALAERLHELVFGANATPDRLDAFANWAQSAQLPNKWTFPTFFLWCCDPDKEVFVKPDYVRGAAQLLELDMSFDSTPNGPTYEIYRSAIAGLRQELADLGPADMTDLQSLLWVALHEYRGVGFWKIAPGEAAWQWEECRDGGFIGIGWDELGDLSELDSSQFWDRVKGLLPKHPDWTKSGVEQVWKFSQIDEGARVVANRGTTEVVGIGTVTGPYHYVEGTRYAHRLPVRWEDVEPRLVQRPGWRRSLIKLSREEFDEIVGSPRASATPAASAVRETEKLYGAAFSAQTFELLAKLRENPTADLYKEEKAGFATYVEEPMKLLLRDVCKKLPRPILELMETERNVFGRIPKNDYGRGGAWPFFWGALYPRGGRRISDPQLFISIDADGLEFGFYIGEYGGTTEARFLENWRRGGRVLIDLLTPSLSVGLAFRRRRQSREGGGTGGPVTWPEWSKDPGQYGESIRGYLPKQRLLSTPFDDSRDEIAGVFARLFPLVLLAHSENPLPDIQRYCGEEPEMEPEELNEPYGLSSWAADSSFSESVLGRWVRAVERKGQAVFYGPPGTGKTFMAERLARHLVGLDERDGFWETVQFHPAYAYEDFIQGIRPRTISGGALAYEMTEGRFLGFCRRAAERKGRCVLIVDEINRANLSRVFGELMYLLEYRDKAIPLAGGGVPFHIPQNVRLVGTMNTADRSIALVDHALRRRFAFLALNPNLDVIRRFHDGVSALNLDGIVEVLREINRAINNSHYELGISFFLRQGLEDQLEDVWRMEVEPYLEEYFFDQESKLAEFRWDKVQARLLRS